MILRIALFMLAAALSLPVAGQPLHPMQPVTPDSFRSEVRLQGTLFGNFFQAADEALEEDVRAFGLEYRTAYRPWAAPTDVYAHVDYLNYTGIDRNSSYGGRVGVLHTGDVHRYNVFLDHAENRTSFDVGDVTASADVTTLGGAYEYIFRRDWELGAEAAHERQNFNRAGGDRDNQYNAIGGSVRYRGFGRIIRPEIGFVTGARSVDNDVDSYDDRYWYLQLTSAPHERIYASVRYRDRDRDYDNIERHDDRKQWVLNVLFRQTERLAWTAYYANETVDSTRAGRDFDTSFLLVGVIYGF